MIGWIFPPMSIPVREIASCDLPATLPACLDFSTCPKRVDPALATTGRSAVRSASSLAVNLLPAGFLEETGPSRRTVRTEPAGTETLTGAAAAAGAAAGTAA